MKKLRATLFAVFCLSALLVACGESPLAPSPDVPLASAFGTKAGAPAPPAQDTTLVPPPESDTTKVGAPTVKPNSGYGMAM